MIYHTDRPIKPGGDYSVFAKLYDIEYNIEYNICTFNNNKVFFEMS